MDELVIKKIIIKNFRGLKNIVIDDLSNVNYTFGLNSTNKSTLLLALRLILEKGYKFKYEFTDEDFNINSDVDDIIEIIIQVNYDANSTDGNKFVTFIGDRWFKTTVTRTENDPYLVEIFESFEGDHWGKSVNRGDWPWLNGVSLIFIKPNYSIEESKNSYLKEFRRHNKSNLESDIKSFQDEIKDQVNLAVESRNTLKKMRDVFEDDSNRAIEINGDGAKLNLNFISLSVNLYNQTTFTFERNNLPVKNLGDGIERIESINYDILKNDVDQMSFKTKIFLLEEIENNLHVTKQREVIRSLFNKFKKSQFFITTHSPNIINISEGNNFIRFHGDSSNGEINSINKQLNIENLSRYLSPFYEVGIAQAIFYENVYLVEGDSEIIFYNTLYNNNEYFRSFIEKNKIYIHIVRGAYGYKFNDFFKSIGINSIAKIDNDLNKHNKPISSKNVCNFLKRKYSELEYFNCEDQDSISIANKINELNKGIIMSTQNDSFEWELHNWLFNSLLSSVNYDANYPNEVMTHLKKDKAKAIEKIFDSTQILELISNLKKSDFENWINAQDNNMAIFKFMRCFENED